MTLEENIRQNLLALPRGIKRMLVAFADACLVVLSVWLAYYLRIGDFIYLTRWTDEHFPLQAVAIGLLIIPLFSIFGMYKLVFRYAGVQTLVSVVKAVTVYSMISVMVITLLGMPGIPRTIGIIQPLLVFFLITSLRLFTALWLGESFAQFFRSQARRNVIIYGRGLRDRNWRIVLWSLMMRGQLHSSTMMPASMDKVSLG